MSLLKVRFRQSGGFAGLIRGQEISAGDSSPEDLQRLEHMLKESGLAERAAGGGARTPSKSADLMQYDVEIETSAGTRHVVLTDDDLDDKTEPLIRFLQKGSKPMKP
jgi:hypothetical protein